MKYKRFLISLVFVGLFSDLSAQSSRIDSLWNEITTSNLIDTSHVDLRVAYINEKIFNDPGDTSLLNFAKETLGIAEELKYVEGQILALQKTGIIFQYFKDQPLIAIDYYQEALLLIDQNTHLKKHACSSRTDIAIISLAVQIMPRQHWKMWPALSNQTIRLIAIVHSS